MSDNRKKKKQQLKCVCAFCSMSESGCESGFDGTAFDNYIGKVASSPFFD